MVKIERKDDGANVSMCGTAEDIMYELGAVLGFPSESRP